MAPPTPCRWRLDLPQFLMLSNLREIREQGHYYVDKSGLAIDLLSSGKYFFLSRPRRLGKSRILLTAHLESEARIDCYAID